MDAPGLEAVFLDAGGSRIIGSFYRAGGDGRRPAVLLLHGLPGQEKNLDLAAHLRQIGLHALLPYHRGAWGSQGEYSCRHLVADGEAALEWLRDRPNVDPERIGLVGFSLGGWVAFQLAAKHPPAALVAVAPLVDPRIVPLPRDLALESAATLQGTTPERLTEEWAGLAPLTGWRPSSPLPILLVTAGRDSLFPAETFAPMQALPQLEHVVFPRADHLFSDVRPGLRHVVARWLVENLHTERRSGDRNGMLESAPRS